MSTATRYARLSLSGRKVTITVQDVLGVDRATLGSPRDEEIQTELMGQAPRGELSPHTVARMVEGRSERPKSGLPGDTVTMPPPIPLLPGSPTS
jgi:hypothetical protein